MKTAFSETQEFKKVQALKAAIDFVRDETKEITSDGSDMSPELCVVEFKVCFAGDANSFCVDWFQGAVTMDRGFEGRPTIRMFVQTTRSGGFSVKRERIKSMA